MSSDIIVSFIIYVTVFRLAIVAAGIVSILLGYQLFCRGIWPENRGGQESTVNATIAGQSFTLKNAAPGTCFALFGVIIISVVFATSPPELSQALSGEIKVRGSPTADAPAAGMQTEELHKRLGEAARAYQVLRDFNKADALYEAIDDDLAASLDHVALLHNELALRYVEEAKNDQAVKHAQIAIMLRPEDSDYIDTSVLVTCKMRGPEVALDHLTELAGSDRAVHEKRRRSLESGSCRID